MTTLDIRSATRALTRRHVAVLGAIALAVTAAFGLDLLAARDLDDAAALSHFAARQPSLVARAGVLAEVAVDPEAAPVARASARRDLELLLARIEAAHDALILSTADPRQRTGAPGTLPIDELDAPLRAYVADTRALLSMADVSPAGAVRRQRAMRDDDTARLAEKLERVAEHYETRQRQSLVAGARAMIAAWAALMVFIVALGVFALRPMAARVGVAYHDARQRLETVRALQRATGGRSDGPVASGAESVSVETPAAPPPRIEQVLLAVAQDELRAAATHYLSGMGLSVTTAGDLADARRLAAVGAFDLVVVDAAVAYSAARDLTAGAPCLALVKDVRAHKHERLLAQGVDLFASAPIDPVEFAAAARFVLDGKVGSGKSGRSAA